MEFGPIQLVVIGFDSIDRFKGEIIAELEAVRSRGVIRLIDALGVIKSDDGEFTAIQDSDFTADEVAEIGSAIRGLIGIDGENGRPLSDAVAEGKAIDSGIGLTIDDVRNAAEALDPGTAVLFLLFEHTWATGLKHAVRNVGGVPIVQGFLTPEAVLMVGAELEAMLEAEATIELAEAVKGAAILDALITVEIANEVIDEAVSAAGEAIAISDAIRAAAAAEAVRALILAELIEDAAAEEAAEALVAAGLIKQAALQAAQENALAVSDEVNQLSATAAD